MGEEDQASYDLLTTFIAGIPQVQRVGRGGIPVVDEDGKVICEPDLIGVKELLESEDPIGYLGSYIIF